jgi:tetrahydromethanopterin S-methyltransferase subunit G
MSEDATTRPTIETVLERINALGESMREGFAAVGVRLDKIEGRLDGMESRLDRLDARLDRTQAEILELRVDFREFRSRFREPA